MMYYIIKIRKLIYNEYNYFCWNICGVRNFYWRNLSYKAIKEKANKTAWIIKKNN